MMSDLRSLVFSRRGPLQLPTQLKIAPVGKSNSPLDFHAGIAVGAKSCSKEIKNEFELPCEIRLNLAQE